MIPESWRSLTIDQLIRFEGGSQPPKSCFINEPREGYVRLIQIRDYRTDKYQTYIPKDRARKFCTKDDVMIGRYGPPLFQILRGIEGAYNVALMKAVPLKGLLREYMYYFLSQEDIAQYLENLSQRTGGQAGVEMDKLKKYPLLLPPIDEQQKITKFLSVWDEAIAKNKQLIINLRQRKKGLMQCLLTGQFRFPLFDDEWKEMELGDFLKPVLRKVEKPKEGYLRLGIRSHGKGTFVSDMDTDDSEAVAMTHLFKVEEGDLVVSITFAWEGAIAIVGKDGDGALVSHRFPAFTFDTKKVSPDFFRYVMLTERFFYYLGLISPGGAGRNRVMNKTNFLKLKIKVPSLDEQKKIGGLLVAIDDHINTLSKKLDLLQQQKKGLMQRLLTGQIRVKV